MANDRARIRTTENAPTPAVNRWQRRRNRTRDALMHAALELFRAKGYDATKLEEITEAANVSPRTFFHHFESKEEVLFGGHRERREELIAALRDRLETKAIWPALRDAMLTIVDAFEADPEFFLSRALLYADEPALRSAVLRVNDALVQEMSEVLAVKLGLGKDGALAPRLMATVANGALRSAIDAWVAARGRSDLRAQANEALDIVRPAIVAAERAAATQSRPSRTSPKLRPRPRKAAL